MKKQKHINIWLRYIILIIITVFLGFLINFFLYAPIKTLADENAWLGFYGSIVGSGIAGIVTLWGIEYTIKSVILNVKPAIRPIKTNYYLYNKDKMGLIVTDKPMYEIMKEYAESKKVYFYEIDKIHLSTIIINIIDEYKGSKWESIFSKIDIDELYKEVKSICLLKTYNDAIKDLSIEIQNRYQEEVGRILSDNIINYLKHHIFIESMNEARDKRSIYYSVYNVGAGNAIDVRISWDFNRKNHKNLCDNLGFNDDEYSNMMNSFSFDAIETAETDVILYSNGENHVKVSVPGEVILLIKHLYIKSQKNIEEKNNIYNNALIGEHQIAKLKVECKDIHGEYHSEYYNVVFRIQPVLQNNFDYKEEMFYLKFNIKK